ncbi:MULTISPECIES: PDC sensor domain-containing protein [unclassified Microbacterium]|uniref:PDC sensor domain-containing protein n=1 Tax=unclassified Microbacterium TaxID=2609290 RepID=UPI0030164BE1
MTGTVAEHDARIAERIEGTFAPLFALVEDWRTAVQDQFGAFSAQGAAPTAAVLDPVMEALARPALEAPGGLVTGSGFVATPGVFADAPWHLAWWLREIHGLDRGDRGGVRRLEAVNDPESDQFRDYRQLEWWKVPERTGERHVTGPYVDYLCTDDYTVTVTTPVAHEGRMVGVVGIDVHVSRLERVVLPILREAEGTGTIVNAAGRVVASSDSHRVTGSLLRGEDVQGALAALREGAVSAAGTEGTRVSRCGDTALVLVLQT